MPKEVITCTVDEDIATAIRKLADKEKRSFSSMVNILLQGAVNNAKAKKTKQ